MSTEFSKMTLPQLLAAKSEIDQYLASNGQSKTKTKTTKTEKPRANKGLSTLHGDFTAMVNQKRKDDAVVKAEYDAFVESRKQDAVAGKLTRSGKNVKGQVMTEKDALIGIHVAFVSFYKKTHADLFAAFESTWTASHPKSATASVAQSEASSVAPESEAEEVKVAPKKRGPKKLVDMTPDEKAAHDAKVAERKAKKTASAPAEESTLVSAPVSVPVAAPVAVAEPVAESDAESDAESEEEGDAETFPFVIEGYTYQRLGYKAADGSINWEGDLWYTKNGGRGNYAGVLCADGSIDTNAEEPLIA